MFSAVDQDYNRQRRPLSLRGLLALVLSLGLATVAFLSGAQALVTRVSSIPLQWRRQAVLEDVCDNGLVLLNGDGIGDDPHVLLLWDMAKGKPTFRVSVDALRPRESAGPKENLDLREGPMRCLDAGKRIIALSAVHLVLIDAEKGAELARVLPSEDLKDLTSSPLLQVTWHVTKTALDVDSHNGQIAAAFNWGTKPRVFLYTEDLRTATKSWELSRYVEDIHLAPDGKKLAVLYSGGFDANGNFVGADPNFRLAAIPDVEIFDTSSGKSLLRFFTGDLEAKIAFSPDGACLYTISLAQYNVATGRKAAIRAFSALDGTLLRTLASPRHELRNSFALSPDGKLIVADASTPAPAFFLKEIFAERAFYRKRARFVILDAQAGTLLYEHAEETGGSASGDAPMRFGFSPDGGNLLVDANHGGWADNERVDVYSLDLLRRRFGLSELGSFARQPHPSPSE